MYSLLDQTHAAEVLDDRAARNDLTDHSRRSLRGRNGQVNVRPGPVKSPYRNVAFWPRTGFGSLRNFLFRFEKRYEWVFSRLSPGT